MYHKANTQLGVSVGRVPTWQSRDPEFAFLSGHDFFRPLSHGINLCILKAMHIANRTGTIRQFPKKQSDQILHCYSAFDKASL